MMLEKLPAHQLRRFMDVKMKKIIAFIFVLVFLLNLVMAQEGVTITKDGPSKIKLGDTVTINIHIENELNNEIEMILREIVVNAEAIEPKLFTPEIPKDIIAARPPYLEWNLVIPAKSNKVVEYKIKPNSIGEYNTGSTLGMYDGKEIYSNDLSISVICNENNKCETELGENYQTCKEDCPSGSKDNFCDLIKDGKCDLDCSQDADIDCRIKLSFWEKLLNWFKELIN